MYPAFLSYMCVCVRICAYMCVCVRMCAYMCVYVLKCLIFKHLLKIDNIGKKRHTKSLQIRKNAVPLHQILEILKAI